MPNFIRCTRSPLRQLSKGKSTSTTGPAPKRAAVDGRRGAVRWAALAFGGANRETDPIDIRPATPDEMGQLGALTGYAYGGAFGDGPDVGRLPLSMFEFARVSMGRRSQRQLDTLPWPLPDPSGHVAVLVRWSVAESDIIDPVR